MESRNALILALLLTASAGAQTLNCDLHSYKALDGLKAEMRSGSLEFTWQGERGQTLHAIFGVHDGQPVVRELARQKRHDAIICLGAVIRGETSHYDFVAGQCASGLQRVQLDTGIPVVFGVLTTDTVDQALVRSEDNEANKGREAALTALQTSAVLSEVASARGEARVGFSGGRR